MSESARIPRGRPKLLEARKVPASTNLSPQLYATLLKQAGEHRHGLAAEIRTQLEARLVTK